MNEKNNIELLKDIYPDIYSDLWQLIQDLDAYTYNHSLRACNIAQHVEKVLGFKDNHLSEAALLHDIGKYYISQKILGKHGGLTTLERSVINSHAYLSYYTLQHYHLPEDICKMVLYHHQLEPILLSQVINKCEDEEIKKKAIILKTIDIFEALTTDRPYHRGVSEKKAISEIRKMEHDKDVIEILEKSKELHRK